MAAQLGPCMVVPTVLQACIKCILIICWGALELVGRSGDGSFSPIQMLGVLSERQECQHWSDYSPPSSTKLAISTSY